MPHKMNPVPEDQIVPMLACIQETNNKINRTKCDICLVLGIACSILGIACLILGIICLKLEKISMEV